MPIESLSDITKGGTSAFAAGGGSGDVVGPASSTANYVPQWSNTTGKLLKAGLPVQTSTIDVTPTALLAMGAFGLPTVANYLALPRPGAVNGTTDFNVVTNAGYYYRILGNVAGSRNANHPDGQTAVTADSGVCDYYYVYNFLYDNGMGNSTQLAIPYIYGADTAKATIKMRHFYGGTTWSPWKSVGGGGGSDPSKQDVLVSGTNIKTINSQSVLGAGDLAVGDVAGPASATVNAVPRFSSTTGKALKAGLKYQTSSIDTTPGALLVMGADAKLTLSNTPVSSIPIACSDETTALAAGTSVVTFRMPYAMTLTAVKASLTTAQASGSVFTVDVNQGGTSILSTKLTIDNTEKTSTTAAAAAVVSDVNLADDAEITIDIDQVGDGTAKGLKVYFVGVPAGYVAGEVITASDPYFDNVVLLHNQDQPSLTDLSPYGHSLLYAGTAARDTSTVKYGTGSLSIRGSGNQVYATAPSAAFALGTGDFTVEAWFNLENEIGNNGVVGNYAGATGWGLAVGTTQSTFYNNGSPVTKTHSALAFGTWHHFAVTRETGLLRLFLDGVQLGTVVDWTGVDLNSTGALAIGNMGTAYPANNWMYGWLDDVRVTKGVCRYVNAFTPPSKLPIN